MCLSLSLSLSPSVCLSVYLSVCLGTCKNGYRATCNGSVAGGAQDPETGALQRVSGNSSGAVPADYALQDAYYVLRYADSE